MDSPPPKSLKVDEDAADPYQKINDPRTSPGERARLRCRLSKELASAGHYEKARAAMGELWRRVGERPVLDGLDEATAAEVLLRAGALSGWLGSAGQIPGAQEIAKDLVSESASIFGSLGDETKVAEAHVELASCYWREGAYDEARITLQEAVRRAGDGEMRAAALLASAMIERATNRFNDALRIHTTNAPLVEASDSHAFKGRFHAELAAVLRNLSAAERREDYLDRALVEYAAASYHFEQAGHTRYRARVENNLGFLYFKVGRFDEATEHLERARRLFVGLKDAGGIAQVDDTRARNMLAQGRNADAETTVRAAVRTLEKGGEQAVLAEALTTHGVALARVGRHAEARDALERAVEVAEQVGDREGAGRAALSLVEELNEHLRASQTRAFYERADTLLRHTEHVETLARLRAAARLVIEAREAPAAKINETHVTEAHEPSAIETELRFIYASEATAELLRHARQLALTDKPILIGGETGTGKATLARLVHEWSGREGEFVAVNCAALSSALVESRLFGHHGGDDSGEASESRRGAAHEATGGTLLLDEVDSLDATNQAKLLRLVECGEIFPVGALVPERVDVRIIAVANGNLCEQVARGNFREDLFYRLALQLEIPPLRERPDDIVAIAKHLIEDACVRHGKRVKFAPASLEAMRGLPLAGNVRELQTLIERTVLHAAAGAEISEAAVEVVALRQTKGAGFADPWTNCSLDEEVSKYESKLIRLALGEARGSVTHAARLLGVTYQGLAFILNSRHKELLDARKPIRRRNRSIIRAAAPRNSKQ